VLFFLRALQQQMQRLAKKVERERIVLSAMPELSVQIVEYAREHGRVTIGDMATLTGTSRNTLKQHFRQLLEKGHLVMHGSGRGACYALV
jgi:predicted HTH transcriptional regulator